MSETVYEDGTEVPPSISHELGEINEEDVIALVKKDGSTYIGRVKNRMISPNEVQWRVGGRLLMTAYYVPFSVTVHDKDIFAILNVKMISDEWIDKER